MFEYNRCRNEQKTYDISLYEMIYKTIEDCKSGWIHEWVRKRSAFYFHSHSSGGEI